MSGPVGGRPGDRGRSLPQPRESADRCALQAQLRGDPMLGTAPPARRLLLVEQSGPWGPRGLVDSRADPEVATRIDVAAAAGGARMQAIRRPGRHADHASDGHRVCLADVESGVTSWWHAATLAELADTLEASVQEGPDGARTLRAPSDARADPAPIYLVCTHGKHDACCALRGRPVVRELAAVRPGRVWETTHVGGDRFAANVLVLPYGELYGRVLPFAAGEFAARVDEGLVVPELMRGRLGLAPVAQAALVHAHGRLAEPHRDALSVRGLERVDADTTRVRLRTPHGTAVVTMAASTTEPEQLTCRGASPARARVYRGTSITWESASAP